MTYTKGDIRRLGERILEANGEVNSEDLLLLQEYRTSFSQPLSDTFNKIIQLKNRVSVSAIVAFRLKRIGTIINKVLRQNEKKINLSRMGDIAGIRLIFGNDREVYSALELIQQQFEQSGKLRDYIKYPKKIGYRGIHIYIIDPVHKKRIEIQIRTKKHHNWSTLVEITDFLYKTRLKEIGYDSHPRFAQFHALMSSDKKLSDKEADLIHGILKEFNFITDLSKLFRKNINEVRKQWVSFRKNSKYFLIEVSKSEIPTLKAFKDYGDAEKEYFESYKKNEHTEIVLTAINKPSFQQISIAYANYILSYHTFIHDVEPIIKELALGALQDDKIRVFKRIFRTYEELQANLILDVFLEVAEGMYSAKIDGSKIVFKTNKNITNSKKNILQNKLDRRLKERSIKHKEFLDEIELYIPDSRIKRYHCKSFIKKHLKRVRKIIKKQEIVIEYEN